MSYIKILQGDCREQLATLPDESVHCCVTSPPYWNLRDYGKSAQIGLEKTPEEYVAEMVSVFREVRRVLRKDGTLWLNLGDSYAHKDLVGIPWRVAFALQADGWYLRQDIIWSKPNAMPESVKDRCTKSHEYIFLLSKSERYFFDHVAIMEKALSEGKKCGSKNAPTRNDSLRVGMVRGNGTTRNRRTVWQVATRPYKGAHFAAFPSALIEPCILAGCPVDGTVLDPFAGSGTTLATARELRRNSIGIELNEDYIKLAEERLNCEPRAAKKKEQHSRDIREDKKLLQLSLFGEVLK